MAEDSVLLPSTADARRDEHAVAASRRRHRVDPHVVSLTMPESFEASQYRRLRLALERLHASRGVSVVAISSPSPGEGKTLTSVNLAATLALAADLRVLLVDADLHRPAVARYLGIEADETPGLADIVHDPQLALRDIVIRQPPLTFDVVASGSLRTVAPYDIFRSPRVGALLREARQAYDYVLIDTPPLVAVPDSQVLAATVDGFVLVVAAHRTSRRLLTEALRERDSLRILGLVFNNDDDTGRVYDRRYYQSPR
ncbi:MAG TPA: CpsD/CapB family tyrosine-protein kinase [Vicinamibacterales bacterium]